MKNLTQEEIKNFKIDDKNINNPHKALGGYNYWHCPRCKEILDSINGTITDKCLICGQIIKWDKNKKENKFKIFKDTSDDELLEIYGNILENKEFGMSADSLKKYVNKIKEICNFQSTSQGYKMTEELFYDEVAMRYFNRKE